MLYCYNFIIHAAVKTRAEEVKKMFGSSNYEVKRPLKTLGLFVHYRNYLNTSKILNKIKFLQDNNNW